MTVINMTQTCKANGIDTFSRTRGGWMKQVEGLDKSQSNGYSFIGDRFIKVGNFKSSIMNGLYLDQSTSLVDNRKVFTMNLFDIQDGEVTLLKTVPKTNGWALELWDEVEKYFNSQDITAQEIVNQIRELTSNQNIINEVIDILKFDAKERPIYPFKNWYEVQSYLAEMECFPVKECLVKHQDADYVIKLKALEYSDKKIITKVLNHINDITIDENTGVDYASVKPETIKRDVFQTLFQLHNSFYIAHTVGNNNGYHNGITVIMFYYDEYSNVVVIRSICYYFDTYKPFQKPTGVFR